MEAYNSRSAVRWARLLVGLIILYAVLQGMASALNSTLGERGLVVALATLAAALLLKRMLFVRSWSLSWRSLGLDWPRLRGMAIVIGLSALMIGAAAIYLHLRGFEGLRANVWWLALGILAQAGLAEELVFRGYFYGHLRRRHPFWRAALLSVAPFAAVHLVLFALMPWPLAAASVGLSIAISFPLAHLYDLGGRTIWAPAIAHAVIQGVPKLVVGADQLFPLVWMGAVLAITSLAFCFNSSSGSRS